LQKEPIVEGVNLLWLIANGVSRTALFSSLWLI